MIRVFLIDDHAILRAGLSALIDNQNDMLCVGQAANGKEALRSLNDTSAVDVALVDLEMPHCDGLKTIELLGETYPMIKTIALTMHQERVHIENALRAGAAAFVAKHVVDQELLQTIRKVALGSSFLCVVGESQGPFNTPAQHARVDELSSREKQVLELLVLGNTKREIAKALHVGTKTVETYRARTSQKLGIRNRAKLVEFAIETGLMQKLVSGFPDKG